MRIVHRLVGVVSVVLATTFSIGAQAQSCVGFTDVPATSPFCPNVEWLKNRGITLGCSSTTLYCPGDPVLRLSMAAFMNRLGKALSPEVLTSEGGNPLVLPTSPPLPRQCVTVDSTVVAYPRSATVHASVTGLTDGNAVAWRTYVMYSTDGGTTWLPAGPPPVAMRAGSGPNQWSGASPALTIDLATNTAYRFAVALQRDDLIAGTTGNFLQSRCRLTATIDNRNGAASPFDAIAAGGGVAR